MCITIIAITVVALAVMYNRKRMNRAYLRAVLRFSRDPEQRERAKRLLREARRWRR
jgi:hypothetical protein